MWQKKEPLSGRGKLDHRGYPTDYQYYNVPKPGMPFLGLHHDFDHPAPIHFILTSYLGNVPSFIL